MDYGLAREELLSARTLMQGVTCVVVDPDKDSASELDLCLRGLGMSVRGAHDVESGLKALSDSRPAVIVTEVRFGSGDAGQIVSLARSPSVLSEVVVYSSALDAFQPGVFRSRGAMVIDKCLANGATAALAAAGLVCAKLGNSSLAERLTANAPRDTALERRIEHLARRWLLSPRQKQALRFVTTTLDNKEAAIAMGIAPETFRVQLCRIAAKMSVTRPGRVRETLMREILLDLCQHGGPQNRTQSR